MKAPVYCRTSGERIGGCKCYRCRPSEQALKPAKPVSAIALLVL